jgi:hypothetical protein
MLHKETVAASTLGLIKQLQEDLIFSGFYLVGGTALALQLGHRKSIDIDLFTQSRFDNQFFLEHLEKEYHFSMQYMHTNTLKGIIDGVFVDFLRHDYTYVTEPISIEQIKMLDKKDIAAMKVNAIIGNGTRSKDFIDIYFLLKEFSFEQILSFYEKKYSERNPFHAIKSLTYFQDMNINDWPQMIKEPKLSITKIKKEIIKQRDIYLNNVERKK